MTTMRSRDQLKVCAEAIAVEQAEDFYGTEEQASFAGMAAALSWVDGAATRSPIDQVEAAPSDQLVERELNAAYDVIYRRRNQTAVVTVSYAQGVEATLLWVLGRTDEPPTPID